MSLLISKTIPAQSGDAFILKEGQHLKVIDPSGQQVSDLFCFDLKDPRDALSSGRSIDYNDSIFLTTGHELYSHRSEKMLQIIDDTCKRHDFLMTPCSVRMFQIVAKKEIQHPSCLENLAVNLSPFKINIDQISTTFNIFMNVEVYRDGKIKINSPLSKAGDYIVFEAKRDLIVGLTACSHEETNGGKCKHIDYEIHS